MFIKKLFKKQTQEEVEVIPDVSCQTCLHCYSDEDDDTCLDCNDNHDKWEKFEDD